MNSVSVDGKDYVKAKDLARDLGYTTDYVGQLCRGGKVDAQLVGRSWYVNEESLREHKQNRYRSNKQESIKEVRRTVAASKDKAGADEVQHIAVHVDESEGRRGYAHQTFYNHTKEHSPLAYQQDESELIPGEGNAVKTGTLGVRLAGAQGVKIQSRAKSSDFSPAARPKLRFKGKLSVVDIEDEVEAEEEARVAEVAVTEEEEGQMSVYQEEEQVGPPVVSEPKKRQREKDTGTRIKVVHRKPTTKRKKRNLPIERNEEGVIGMRRDRIVDRNPVGGTLKVHAEAEAAPGVHMSSMTVVLTLLVSIICGVLISSLEQSVAVVNGEMVVRYTIDFENVLAAAYDAFSKK